MTLGERVLGGGRTRAETVRARRARHERRLEVVRRRREPRRSRRRRPRRRFDLALPVELGAEIRLPALPNIKPGPRLASAAMLILVVILLRSLLLAPQFFVAEAVVAGNDLLMAHQVRSIAQVDDLSVFLIDPSAGEARFSSIPEVASAKIRVGWPNRVEIQIAERVPLVSWHDGYRDWWLSEEGVAFLKHGEREGLVHIHSETPVLDIQRDPLAQVIDPQVLVAAGVLAAQIPETNSLLYDTVHGLGFEDERGWTAFFGVKGDMVMKVRLYRAIGGHLEQRSIAPSLVSVKEPSAPYYSQ